jgi:hypothetical protein
MKSKEKEAEVKRKRIEKKNVEEKEKIEKIVEIEKIEIDQNKGEEAMIDKIVNKGVEVDIKNRKIVITKKIRSIKEINLMKEIIGISIMALKKKIHLSIEKMIYKRCIILFIK